MLLGQLLAHLLVEVIEVFNALDQSTVIRLLLGTVVITWVRALFDVG